MTPSPQLTLVFDLCTYIGRFALAIRESDTHTFHQVLSLVEQRLATYRASHAPTPPTRLVYADPYDPDTTDSPYPRDFFPIDDDDL